MLSAGDRSRRRKTGRRRNVRRGRIPLRRRGFFHTLLLLLLLLNLLFGPHFKLLLASHVGCRRFFVDGQDDYVARFLAFFLIEARLLLLLLAMLLLLETCASFFHLLIEQSHCATFLFLLSFWEFCFRCSTRGVFSNDQLVILVVGVGSIGGIGGRDKVGAGFLNVFLGIYVFVIGRLRMKGKYT